jgi:hypothetical protein
VVDPLLDEVADGAFHKHLSAIWAVDEAAGQVEDAEAALAQAHDPRELGALARELTEARLRLEQARDNRYYWDSVFHAVPGADEESRSLEHQVALFNQTWYAPDERSVSQNLESMLINAGEAVYHTVNRWAGSLGPALPLEELGLTAEMLGRSAVEGQAHDPWRDTIQDPQAAAWERAVHAAHQAVAAAADDASNWRDWGANTLAALCQQWHDPALAELYHERAREAIDRLRGWGTPPATPPESPPVGPRDLYRQLNDAYAAEFRAERWLQAAQDGLEADPADQLAQIRLAQASAWLAATRAKSARIEGMAFTSKWDLEAQVGAPGNGLDELVRVTEAPDGRDFNKLLVSSWLNSVQGRRDRTNAFLQEATDLDGGLTDIQAMLQLGLNAANLVPNAEAWASASSASPSGRRKTRRGRWSTWALCASTTRCPPWSSRPGRRRAWPGSRSTGTGCSPTSATSCGAAGEASPTPHRTWSRPRASTRSR